MTFPTIREHFDRVVAYKIAKKAENPEIASMENSLRDELQQFVASPAYKNFNRNAADYFFAMIRDSGELDRMLQNDPDFMPDQDYEFLQNCTDQLSSLMSSAGVSVSAPILKIYGDTSENAFSGYTQFYPMEKDPDTESIFINQFYNTWSNGKISGFQNIKRLEAMYTVCHEMDHFFNIALCRAYHSGDIKEGGRFYHEAEYFGEMFVKRKNSQNGYIDSSIHLDLNRLQLDERCAYGFEKLIRQRVEDYKTERANAATRFKAPMRELPAAPVMAYA